MNTNSRRNFLKFGAMATGVAAAAPILSASTIVETDKIKWDDEFDVIVVGSGLSAHISAIVTAEAGLKTVMLEKMSRTGGNSVISQQDFAVMGSDKQAKDGIKDSVELYVKDLSKAGRGMNDIEHTRRLAEHSNRAYEFAKKCGVEYRPKLTHLGGHSVPRTIQTKGGGNACIKSLNKHFLAQKGELRNRVKAEEIIKDKDGKVIGLMVKEKYRFNKKVTNDDRENKKGKVKYYKAKKAVVFGTGGFSRDKEFRTIQNPKLQFVGTPSNLGATAGALKSMITAGATPTQLALTRFSFGIPTEDLKYAMMADVNTGKRFANEDSNRQDLSNTILDHMMMTNTEKYPVMIFDSVGFKNSHDPHRMNKYLKKGKIKKLNTIAEVAKEFKVPVAALEAEVAKYNKAIDAKNDAEFGKDISKLKGAAAKKAPFYAIKGAPNLSYTQGGVRVTPKLEVIDMNTNAPIPGLFAVGEATGGTHGFSRLTSCSIPDCMTSGLIAGETIAKL